jgi:flagellar hook-associated protein 3 FlgL
MIEGVDEMLRLSTRQSFDSGLERLQQRQQELTDSQLRLTSGKRVLRASDDPAAAARAERAMAAVSRHEANQRALDVGRNGLTLAEGALGDASELLQQVRETLVAAGNGAYTDGERATLADRLQSLRAQLLAAANRGDGGSAFVFGGQGSAEPPFIDAPGGVVFRGVGGDTRSAVDEALPQALDASREWLAAPSGNGLFETRNVAGMPTQASAWIDAGRVFDPSAFFAATSPPAVADPANLSYQITFSSGAGGTTFSVEKDGVPTALTNAPFVSGQAIEIDGMSFTISGAPTVADWFEVRLSSNSQSVFDTLDRAMAELRTPLRSSAAVSQGVQRALTQVDASMNALAGLRARVGEALVRADGIEARTAEQKVTAQTERSNAEDLDMVEAISLFQNRQSGYQAALQAYASVQRLSLFQYINNS